MLKALRFIIYIELLLLLRRSQEWLYPLSFFIITLSLFPLAFTSDNSQQTILAVLPGSFWIAALFANLLALQTIFLADMEDAYLEQLPFARLPFTFIIFTKLAAYWIVTQLPLILITPILAYLFGLPNHAILNLVITLLLGTPILTLLGSFGVALTLGLRQQGVLLGLLILPLTTPVLIFGVNIVRQSIMGLATVGPLLFLAGLMTLAITLLPIAIAFALRFAIEE